MSRTGPLVIAGREFSSRLILGSGKYPDNDTFAQALEASGTEMVTVAVRRVDLTPGADSLLRYIDRDRYALLPNTAGCYTAQEAIHTARLAREVGLSSWIKLEVIGDLKTLFPDHSKTGGNTEALPLIWEKKDTFLQILQQLEASAAAAQTAIKDEATFRAEWGKVSANCRACHKVFRVLPKS